MPVKNSPIRWIPIRSLPEAWAEKETSWDNAVAESFFKTLKSEQIYNNKLVSKEQVRMDLFEYIEIWYTKDRRHSAFGKQNYRWIMESIKKIK